MTVPSGCAEWTHPPSDDVDLSFGSPPSTQHNKVDLRWCEALNPPEEDQPVILPAGGTSTTAAAGESVDLQFGPDPAPAHDVVHLVWGEGATDPDAPPQRSAFYGLGGASQAQAAELARVVADGAEATIQAITTTQSPSNPDDRTPVADADAVAKDWAEQTRRVRLPNDNTDRAPDDMERVVTPQTVQRTLTLDLRKIGALSARIENLLSRAREARRRRINFISRLRILEAIGDNPIQGAWCADYTEDLEGEVRSIEVPDEGRENLLIYPGYYNGHIYNAARDGQLFWREGQPGYQVYFNAAILPGVQRWHPQFRFATIESIDKVAHTATIAYASMDSSAQGLLITDPLAKRTDVPIVYMQCHSAVFEEGDQVLVELQERDWQQPKIIGFRDNPKQCFILVGYFLGWNPTSDLGLIDQAGTTYPSVPDGWFRNVPINQVRLQMFMGGEAQALVWTRDFDEVIEAETVSQLPPVEATGILAGTQTDLLTVTVPDSAGITVNGSGNIDGIGQPFNKPNDPYVIEDGVLTVTNRQYPSASSGFYQETAEIGRYYWSNTVSATPFSEQAMTIELTDVLEFVVFGGSVYERHEIVSYTQPDYIVDRSPASGLFTTEIVGVLYKPRPDL